jgi:uncharacterized protein
MMALSNVTIAKRDELLRILAGYGSCAVAFSGGVDSAVLAKAAHLALGDDAVLVTGTSAALAEGELDEARKVAALIGARHFVVSTEEFSNPNYLANRSDRCYHCKTELYSLMGDLAAQLRVKVIANGAIVDDLGDYRPGMRAANEHQVRSPLAECGFTKPEVRELAAAWGLPIAEKPASPCLSSRIAYGLEVTPERLAMVDHAERLLRSVGIRELRVRYHAGDLARIEVLQDEISKLCEPTMRNFLIEEFRTLGFKFVTLDLAGFRSGGLNQLIAPEELQRYSS